MLHYAKPYGVQSLRQAQGPPIVAHGGELVEATARLSMITSLISRYASLRPTLRSSVPSTSSGTAYRGTRWRACRSHRSFIYDHFANQSICFTTPNLTEFSPFDKLRDRLSWHTVAEPVEATAHLSMVASPIGRYASLNQTLQSLVPSTSSGTVMV
jgi:hypothetical protein